MSPAHSPKRELNLDIIRIVSIAIVLFSHFSITNSFHIAGTFGVVLFFFVSGYCILMTSYKKDSFKSFWKARYLRLLPLFLLCTLVVHLFKSTFSYILPERATTFVDYLLTSVSLPALDLPFLFLAGPNSPDYTFVDGAFWSLLVEFRFYFLFSVLWFLFGLRKSVIFILLLLSFFCLYTQIHFNNRLNDFFLYLPFFSFGMSFYEFENKSKRIGLAGLLLSFICFSFFCFGQVEHVSLSLSQENFSFYATGFLVFTGLMLLFKNRNHLSNRFITHLALLSYPIYLLHQEMGLIEVKFLNDFIPVQISGLCAIASAVSIAYLLNKIIEILFAQIKLKRSTKVS